MTPPAAGLAALTTVKDCIARYAEETPQQAFFLSAEDGRVVTWRMLAAAMPAVAALAARLQVRRGETLAFMLQNGWTAVQLLLGGISSGRVMLPLNLTAGDEQIAYVLQQSRCRAVLTDHENHARLKNLIARHLPAAAQNALQIHAVSSDGGIDDDDSTAAADSSVDSSPAPPPHSRALLMYTSGTTGMPKGAAHTQESILAGGKNVALAHQLTAADRALCVLPLFHINGLCVTVMAPLFSGGSVVMPRRFRTEDFWRHIGAQRCTWFSVVPTMIAYLLKSPPQPLPPSLRFGRSASAPLPPAAHEEFERRFGIPLIETMGLTETAAQILANPLPPAARKVGSPGVPVGNEVRVLRESGGVCAPGETGELVVRGANVMRDYNDNPEETAAAFTADGWLRTGDIGYRDQDGYFFITGRKKELIIKGGENIAPREIDEALLRLPQVIDAAAFARACARYGQRVEACVTLKAGSDLDEPALIAHCEKIVGKFKSPDRIYFVDDMPRGPSGKVQRLKLEKFIEHAEQ